MNQISFSIDWQIFVLMSSNQVFPFMHPKAEEKLHQKLCMALNIRSFGTKLQPFPISLSSVFPSNSFPWKRVTLFQATRQFNKQLCSEYQLCSESFHSVQRLFSTLHVLSFTDEPGKNVFSLGYSCTGLLHILTVGKAVIFYYRLVSEGFLLGNWSRATKAWIQTSHGVCPGQLGGIQEKLK